MGVKPEENINISILSLKGNYIGEAYTDRNGKFYLHDGELTDSTWFMIQAAPQSNKQDIKLSLDKESYPKRVIPVVASGLTVRDMLSNDTNKAEQQYVNQYGAREIHLTTQKKPAQKSSYYHIPDYSITKEQIDSFPPTSLNELLKKLPGLTITNDTVRITRFEDCTSILWLIDDYPVISTVKIWIEDIEQIDLLTSPKNLVAFGDWGKCGVIAIHTRIRKTRTIRLPASENFIPIYTPPQQGVTGSPGYEALLKDALYMKRIMPLGFQKPAEFYAPKYNTPTQNTKPDLRTTIHWQPNLTTDETGKALFSFYTADTPGTYTVVIEGVTDDGKIVYKRDKIKVR